MFSIHLLWNTITRYTHPSLNRMSAYVFSFQTIWWSSINGVMDRDQVVSCCSSLNNGISHRFNTTSHNPPHKLSLQKCPTFQHKHMHEDKMGFDSASCHSKHSWLTFFSVTWKTTFWNKQKNVAFSLQLKLSSSVKDAKTP